MGIILKKIGVGMLLLMLVFSLSLIFDVKPAKAFGFMTILGDGSIYPPEAPIQRNDNIYTFTENVNIGDTGMTEPALAVYKDNIIIDGAGHTLEGPGKNDGMYLYGRRNVTIKNITIKNFNYGIGQGFSSGCTVCANTLTGNVYDGVLIGGGEYTNIFGNTITNNRGSGIELADSWNNNIYENKITDNYEGITLGGLSGGRGNSGNSISANAISTNSGRGIIFGVSSDSSISANNITNNGEAIWVTSSANNNMSGNTIANNGIGIDWLNSSYNAVVGNNITNNGQGVIFLSDSSNDNKFYHNDFISNELQVNNFFGSRNIWDNGYPSGGNYWNDYTGIDLKSGANQDLPGSDGIGDTPYIIDANNTDHYPQGPTTRPYSVTIVSHCDTENADVTVPIFMDGLFTGHDTPCTFTGISGSHVFAVLGADSTGHLFGRWSTGQTSTTITVSENGTYTAYYGVHAPPGNVTRVPQEYTSIQAAIDAAPPNSTIIISPGVYNESIIINKNLTIKGLLGSEPVFRGGGIGIAITLMPGASGCVISGIIITNWDEAIHIINASECKIINNIMSQINDCGITVNGSNTLNNIITSNIFENSTVAVNLSTASNNNTVYRNIIITNTQALLLGSSTNLVCANTIVGNSIALNLTGSGNNLVFHNNFVNNTTPVSVSASAMNTWDNGYPSGGNYWSGHAGVDLYSGPNQDQRGGDGFLDVGYVVADGGVDRYPLAEPFNAHDIGVTDFAVAKTAIGGGYDLNMTVKILNYGLYDESFPVTVFANTTIAVTKSVWVAKCNYTVVALAWNTTDFAIGNCTIRVYAGPVDGETNTGDNNYTRGGCVYVGALGDVSADGRVDMKDIGYIARRFGVGVASSLWDPNADINGDGKVDMKDIGTTARHFGENV